MRRFKLLGKSRRPEKNRSVELCTSCGGMCYVEELTTVKYALLCPDCVEMHVQGLLPGMNDELADKLTREQKRQIVNAAATAQMWLEHVLSFLPFAVYVGLYLWSERSTLGYHIFTGYLIADVITWLIRAFIDLRERTWTVFAQFAIYVAIVHFWVIGAQELGLPEASEDRAIVSLVGMGVFGIKSLVLVLEQMHGKLIWPGHSVRGD